MAREHKKIKILFTIPDFDTAGSGKALLKIATSLNREVFEPHIACQHNKGTFFKLVEKSGIPVHIIKYTTQMKPYHKGLLACRRISKAFKKIAPDLIHSFHFGADYSEPLAAKIAGIKWIYSKKNMNWGGSSKNSWKMRTLLASHLIYQNTDMKRLFFPKSNKVSLVTRGVDINEFFASEKNQKLLELYNLTKDDRILIVVANLVPLKGVDILINAFKQAHSLHTDWKLLIVGDNKNEHGLELKELVKDLAFDNNVIFTGKVLNVNEYLNLAEIFILPTIYRGEGSPVALLEAMAAGVCVLGSDLPGIKDQLQDFSEHLIEAGNIEKWRDVLMRFGNMTREELKQKGDLFTDHVHKKFTLTHEVNKTERLYLKLLK